MTHSNIDNYQYNYNNIHQYNNINVYQYNNINNAFQEPYVCTNNSKHILLHNIYSKITIIKKYTYTTGFKMHTVLSGVNKFYCDTMPVPDTTLQTTVLYNEYLAPKTIYSTWKSKYMYNNNNILLEEH